MTDEKEGDSNTSLLIELDTIVEEISKLDHGLKMTQQRYQNLRYVIFKRMEAQQ